MGLADDDWHLTDQLHAEHGKADPFAAAVRATRMPMIVCDPRQPDMPIVFANAAFLGLTGYARHEVIGRNCRFLQGPDTDRDAVAVLRDAIRDRRDVHVELLNYRKNGTTFWNALYISPVSNEAGDVRFFFASQLDVTGRKEQELRIRAEKEEFEAAVRERTRSLELALEAKNALLHEVDHRVKNNLQTIAALVAMEARAVDDPEIRAAFARLTRRVEAVATVHRRLYEEDAVDRFDVGSFARVLADQLRGTAGVEIAASVDPSPILVPAASASPIALMLNELLLDAAHDGPIAVTITQPTAQHVRIAVEARGGNAGSAAPAEKRAQARELVRRLGRQLRGSVEEGALRFAIDIPLDHPGGLG